MADTTSTPPAGRWHKAARMQVVRQPKNGLGPQTANSVIVNVFNVAKVQFTLIDATNKAIPGKSGEIAVVEGRAGWGFWNPAEGVGYRVLIEDADGCAQQEITDGFDVAASGPAPTPNPTPDPVPTPVPPPAPAAPTAADAAAFVAPLTVGVAIERWRAVSLTYQGKALGNDPAYWAYLRSLGVTHVRLTLPWRVTIQMFEGWVNGAQPSDAQIDTMLQAAATAIIAGLRVLYDCADIISAADVQANRGAIENVIASQAARIAAAGDRLPPNRFAVGPFAELDFDSNAACNDLRLAGHRTLRAKLPKHILVTSAARKGAPEALLAPDWQMVPDQGVILKWHDAPGVPGASYFTGLDGRLKALSAANGGVPVLAGSVMEGTTAYDDGWVSLIGLYAQHHPLARATHYSITDGGWFNLAVSRSDPTLRPNLAAALTRANAVVQNSADWRAQNPSVTPVPIPVDPPPTPNPPPAPTPQPPSTNTSDKGAILPPGFRTVWQENFDNGVGMLSNVWGPGIDQSVRGQITARSTTDNKDSGAETHPDGYPNRYAGWSYGLYSFLIETNGVIGGYALTWPGSDVWPGPEMDVLEIQEDGIPYATLHWKAGDGKNAYHSVQYRGVDPTKRHTYSMLWEPGRVTFFCDGVSYGSVDHDVSNDFANGGENTCPGIGMQTSWNSGGRRGSSITCYQVIYSVRA